MAASRRSEAPPIVHALGGSIGSALALLLFYPLERARIEIQSKAAEAESGANPTELADLSPIKRVDDSQIHNIVDESSWDRAEDSPPASWSMNSCTIDDNSNAVSTLDQLDDSVATFDVEDGTGGILRCLLDLRERGVLYKGVKPIISTIFTRYDRRLFHAGNVQSNFTILISQTCFVVYFSQFVFFFLHAYAKGWLLKVAPASTKSSSPLLSLTSGSVFSGT